MRGTIRITSEVDATADVEDKEGFLYRVETTAGQESRLQDLKRGMTVSIRQGLELLRKIVIEIRQKQKNTNEINELAPWHGRLVPMPSRYAWVLRKLDTSGEAFRRTEKALKDGMIPLDGLKMLKKIAEER